MNDAGTEAGRLDGAPLENAQLLHLIQDCSNNLRHAKTYQWHAGHFTILAYAGLVASAFQVADIPLGQLTPWVASGFSVLIFAAGTAGIWMVWNLQVWMAGLRGTIYDAEMCLSSRYRDIASGRHGSRERYSALNYRPSQTWLISAVIGVSGPIAITVALLKLAPP